MLKVDFPPLNFEAGAVDPPEQHICRSLLSSLLLMRFQASLVIA